MANIMQGITHQILQAMYAHAHYLTNLLPNFQKGGGFARTLFLRGGGLFERWGGGCNFHIHKKINLKYLMPKKANKQKCFSLS